MGIVLEFKKFALRGNIFDLAIGIIIGGSFNKLVSSLVEDIVMPFVGLFLGKVDFSSLAITVGNTTFKYGSFIQSSVDFLLVSISVFMLVKGINMLQEDNIKIGYTPVDVQQLNMLKEIRSLLKDRK